MRNLRTIAIVLLTWLASGESFVAWSKHENKITPRRKDYADYFSSILDSPPPRSVAADPPSSSRETCLYVSPDLPQCDFDRFDSTAEANEDTREDYQQIYDRSGAGSGVRFPKPTNMAPSSVLRAAENGRIIVYTIEGCLPERLPFDMPACKHEDFIDGLFEVRKLYPFRVKASSSKETFVFPEFNFGQWLKMMRRYDERESSSRVSVAEEVGVMVGDAPKEEEEESGTKNDEVSRHRQSVLISATKRKTTMPRATIASRYVSKGSPLNSLIVSRGQTETKTQARHERISPRNAYEKVADDLVLLEFRPLMDSSFYRAKKRNEKMSAIARRNHNWSSFDETTLNELGAAGQIDSLPVSFREARSPARNRREVIRKGSEFPYAKAIPFDPKKLGQHPRKTRQIPRDDDSRQSTRRKLSFQEARHRYKPETTSANRGKHPRIHKNHFAKVRAGKHVRQ